MKKHSFLTLFVAAALLAGCSDNSNEPATIYNSGLLSNVPILLMGDGNFSTSVTTRTGVDSVMGLGEQVGIFCVAREKTGITGSAEAKNVNWSTVVSTDPENYGYTTNGIYWSNVRCRTVRNNNIKADTVDLQPVNSEDYIWYYPVTNWYGYDFYGYYPYQSSYTHTSDSITADFTIDGTNDILWGRSDTISGDKYAYSAHYFNTHTQSAAHMKFNHALTRFQFYIVAAKNKEGSYNDVKALCVKEIRMIKVHTTLRMTVANRVNRLMSGTIYPSPSQDITATLKLKDAAGNEVSQNPVPFATKTDKQGKEIADTVRVGDCLMVCPNAKAYYMGIGLCDRNNPDKEYWSEKNITISMTSNGRFLKNTVYKIYISVSGVSGVNLNASLQDWDESVNDGFLNFTLE